MRCSGFSLLRLLFLSRSSGFRSQATCSQSTRLSIVVPGVVLWRDPPGPELNSCPTIGGGFLATAASGRPEALLIKGSETHTHPDGPHSEHLCGLAARMSEWMSAAAETAPAGRSVYVRDARLRSCHIKGTSWPSNQSVRSGGNADSDQRLGHSAHSGTHTQTQLGPQVLTKHTTNADLQGQAISGEEAHTAVIIDASPRSHDSAWRACKASWCHQMLLPFVCSFAGLSLPWAKPHTQAPSAPEDLGSLPDWDPGRPSRQAAESVLPSGGPFGEGFGEFFSGFGNAISSSASPNWIYHRVQDSVGLFSFSIQHVTGNSPTFFL